MAFLLFTANAALFKTNCIQLASSALVRTRPSTKHLRQFSDVFSKHSKAKTAWNGLMS